MHALPQLCDVPHFAAKLTVYVRILCSLLAGQKATSNTDDERPLFLRITPGRTLPPVSLSFQYLYFSR